MNTISNTVGRRRRCNNNRAVGERLRELRTTILIAGPSGSGKSSLAARVADGLGASIFSLDDYYLGGRRIFVDASHGRVRTFERPELYDGERLARKLAATAAQHPSVAEGFCLLQYESIAKLNALRYYIEVPFTTCLARRLARRPQRRSDESFQLIGESESRLYVEPQRSLPGVVILDGSVDVAELTKRVLETARQYVRTLDTTSLPTEAAGGAGRDSTVAPSGEGDARNGDQGCAEEPSANHSS